MSLKLRVWGFERSIAFIQPAFDSSVAEVCTSNKLPSPRTLRSASLVDHRENRLSGYSRATSETLRAKQAQAVPLCGRPRTLSQPKAGRTFGSAPNDRGRPERNDGTARP